MTDIPGDSTTSATVTVGSTTEGSLETVGDHDWFRIELTAGQTITIELNGASFNGVEDPYLRLRDSSGNLLFENDDGGDGLNSRLTFTAPYTGVYYIDVGSWNDGSDGEYVLTVNPYAPPPVGTMDDIADQLASGYWGGFSYHFDTAQGGSITVNLTALTVAGQNLAREALGLWTDIIGVTFVEVATGGQITFDDEEDGAFADFSATGDIITSAHVNISTQWLVDYGTGLNSYSFQTYVHEIGHALGLGHAGNYNMEAQYPYDALFQIDGWPATIMSYFDQQESSYWGDQGFTFHWAVTPMMADIMAMSMLYGLSTTTRTGDTTYGFNSNAGRAIFNASLYPDVAYTIFDSGGTDTLDYSGFAANQLINLNAESFSNVGGGVGNVGIARGVTIENAIGGSGNDILIGNAASNRLTGGSGNDALDGGPGADTMLGGTGDDIYYVSDSADAAVEHVGEGTDIVVSTASYRLGANIEELTLAGSGNVYGIGNELDNMLAGNDGSNALYGRDGNDILIGNGGDDSLYGEEGADLLYGGAGNDIYYIDDADDHAFEFAGEGVDLIVTTISHRLNSEFEDLLMRGTGSLYGVGNELDNVLRGNSGSNALYGRDGNDRLIGKGGDDSLYGEGGADILYGGAGNDIYYIDDASDLAFEFAGEGTDLVVSTINYSLRSQFEDLLMRGFADIYGVGNELANVLTGNEGANALYGRDGDDRLIGKGGDDRLYGEGGADTMYGGAGNDAYYIDDVGDIAIEFPNAGSDVVVSSISYRLAEHFEKLTFSGTANLDGIGNGVANTITGNDGANALFGFSGDDLLVGKGGNDRLYGGVGADVLVGGDGNDRIDGGGGRDRLYGNLGADDFVFRDGDFAGLTPSTSDQVHDFSKADGDRIHLSFVDADTNIEGDQAFAFLGTEHFTGNAGQLRYEQIDGNTFVQGDVDGDGFADFWIRLDGLHTLESDNFVF